jgi:GH15 family glucan-1,4-alpha-glucosidase
MPSRIEDYALIGDTQTAALVARDGSIDWLCVPRFDSGACFAALLGTPEHGRWQIAPACDVTKVTRRYQGDTLVLETTFETESGTVSLIDAMPPRSTRVDLVRMVVGRSGRVPMRTELIFRFDYGSWVPWVQRASGGLRAIAGPDAVRVWTPVPLSGQDFTTVGEFEVRKGDEVPFVLAWYPSNQGPPRATAAAKAIESTRSWWAEWSKTCSYAGPSREAVVRSLITLKALTYAPTGGLVAAPTTSLPEKIGGERNWDYRLCWIRDATFTLFAMLAAGYEEEARAWREWLLRAAAGRPDQLQVMFGPAGERRLEEQELPWLPGYEGSRPVRVGNAAVHQFQLDVFGEVMDLLHQGRTAGLPHKQGRTAGLPHKPAAWNLQLALMEFLESAWDRPDEGIWEVREQRRHFTHSKVMAWVAFDRAIKAVEHFGERGPVERWRAIRDRIHRQVCERGFDRDLGAFVQSYGTTDLDASLLMIPLVGFLPATDSRVIGTVERIQRDLTRDGLVLRYRNRQELDGLPVGEGTFLMCSFWLADNLALMGRRREAREIFERLLSLRNDVGLLSEQYDPDAGRLVGNFPQAFTHVSLVNTAFNLSKQRGPARHRRGATRDAAGDVSEL